MSNQDWLYQDSNKVTNTFFIECIEKYFFVSAIIFPYVFDYAFYFYFLTNIYSDMEYWASMWALIADDFLKMFQFVKESVENDASHLKYFLACVHVLFSFTVVWSNFDVKLNVKIYALYIVCGWFCFGSRNGLL